MQYAHCYKPGWFFHATGVSLAMNSILSWTKERILRDDFNEDHTETERKYPFDKLFDCLLQRKASTRLVRTSKDS